jgi:hypothetical protein
VLKGSTQTNKKIKLRFKKKGAKETEENPGLTHRTVRCATRQCPVPRVVRVWTCHLRVSEEPLRYNSPDCPVHQRSNGSSAMVDYNGHLQKYYSAQTVRAEWEQPPEGALDSEQCLSSAAPDYPVPHEDKAPTVETVRTLTVGWRGWRTGQCPMHPSTAACPNGWIGGWGL